MTEGEGRGEGEDLFEDLDKFFAPIQDVDWPESSGAAPSRAAEPEPREPEPREPEPALEAPDRGTQEPEPAPSLEAEDSEPAAEVPTADRDATMGSDVVDVSEPAPGTGEPASVPGPGQEDLFAPEPVAAGGGSEGGDADADDGVASFLFESEAEEYDEIDVKSTEMPAAPGGYVDLPGPDDDAVAELIEDEVEEAPDIEAVEAAAEHFAESVRDEVQLEPSGEAGPAEPRTVLQPTEEVAIATLLADGDTDAVEPEGARTVRVGAEGLGGPSWQEPTAVEIGAESERGPAGRDVPLAFLTGVILAALALGALAIGPGWFAILAGIVVLFAQGELYLALQKRHYQPATALGLVAGALVLGAGYYRGEGAMLAITALSTFATFLWYMTVPPQHRRNIVSNIALTVFGFAYIPLLAAYALSVLKLPDGRGLALDRKSVV